MYNDQDSNYTRENGSSSYNSYQHSSNYAGDFYERNRNNGYQEPKKPKKGGTFKKVVLAILLGAFFGVSAGVCFYGVNQYTASKTEETASTEITEEAEEAVAEAQTTAQQTVSVNQSVTAVVTDVTNVVEEVMPSVVSITNTSVITQNFWGQSYTSESESSGSGIIIGENDNELLIVTNNHVVEDSDNLKVQFIDSNVADAKVKGTDSNMDLAVIAVNLDDLSEDTKSNISIAVLGDSDELKVGEPAIAIGNALGYGQSVTTGVISALNRQIAVSDDGSTSNTLIQTDAAINPGNSGGALLNINGEVVGINSNKIGGDAIEGMGYAIPISSAKPIIEELMNQETKDKVDESRKGYLGISGLDVTSDVSSMYGMPEGIFVAKVYDGGAKNAGILKGDIITGFAGSTVTSMEELQEALAYYEVGESVSVTVQRASAGGYTQLEFIVTLGEQAVTQD
jgi:serine protease Do